MNPTSITQFSQLDLPEFLLKTLDKIGYETPSPIQAQTVPLLLDGNDVIGQAQTGTGKTAAFALPIVARLDLKVRGPQVLVLTPTRELAIQVAEAFQRYASLLPGFRVLPIYGGQDYQPQIKALSRGVHVIVGTPGRVMDHMRRKTLKLNSLTTLVLDEADEMLKMGFIDDVEWVLEQAPDKRQIALFSATMPKPIRKIAAEHLNDPVEVTIKVKTTTADTIRQRYWPVRGPQKLDALTRILEAEVFDAMLVFVRTKNATTEVAERLTARGFAATALNGDIPQNMREKIITQLRNKSLDILVATDVAARGLDVNRISHVINYDIPHDTESYVHRIGRTGRAGRTGDAILFITPREKHLLSTIEKSTRQSIKLLELPSNDQINARRIEKFKDRIRENIDIKDKHTFTQLIESVHEESGSSMLEIAAALARMAQGNTPLLLDYKSHDSADKKSRSKPERGEKTERATRKPVRDADKPKSKAASVQDPVPSGMVRYRMEVGKKDEITAAILASTIEQESGLEHQFIGRIKIRDDFSEVDLPDGMPKAVFKILRKTWIDGKNLDISHLAGRYKTTEGKGARDDAPKRKSGVKRKRDTDKSTTRKSSPKKTAKKKAARKKRSTPST